MRNAVFCCLLVLVCACGQEPKTCASGPVHIARIFDDTMEQKPPLDLRFTVSEGAAIGYAYTFNCKVIAGGQRNGIGEMLSMTIEPREKETLAMFEKAADGDTLQARFEWFRDNCEYNHIPITGFVDGKRRAWKLVSVENYVPHP